MNVVHKIVTIRKISNYQRQSITKTTRAGFKAKRGKIYQIRSKGVIIAKSFLEFSVKGILRKAF